MCNIDDCEPCTWLGTTPLKAIKYHSCDECGRTIVKGEIYHRSAYVADGSMHSNKACAHCMAARAWLTKHCGGWVTEGLEEELREHFDDGYREDNLGRLAVGVRRAWRRFHSDGLMPVPVVP